MDNSPTLELMDYKSKPQFKTKPTEKPQINRNEAVSFCLDFARARPLVEGYAPLPRPYRTVPMQPTKNDDARLDAAIAAAMPTIEEIEAMTVGPCNAWRDDTSWIESDEG